MADISNDKNSSFSIVGASIKLLDSLKKSYNQRREDNLRKDLKKQEDKILNRFMKKAGLTEDILSESPEAMDGLYESDEFAKAFDKLHRSNKYAKLFHKEQNTVNAKDESDDYVVVGSDDPSEIGLTEKELKKSKTMADQKQDRHEQAQNKYQDEIKTAKKAGYVQGVCECVAAIGSDYALGKKLLAEMSVTKKLAKEYANPEIFKALESGIFAQAREQELERRQRRGHRR